MATLRHRALKPQGRRRLVLVKSAVANLFRIDLVLALSLALNLAFCLHGIHWGRAECWNPDQVAYQPLFVAGQLPFEPVSFLHPPFHTYVSYAVVHIPVHLLGKLLRWTHESTMAVGLVACRLLTAALLGGSICLLFGVSRRAFGTIAARAITLLYATSAGLVAFAHFLTSDVPLIFWMMLALYCAQSILFQKRTASYLLAGLFAGIATATKYNGLAVGICLVASHFLAYGPHAWRTALQSSRLYVGLLAVLAGFLLGNPFALIRYPRFIADFWYNNLTAPIYEGEMTNSSYLTFLVRIGEIIGWPVLALTVLALLAALVAVVRGGTEKERKTLLLAGSLLGLYYLVFGSFPRLPARFVLPMIPIWLLLSGPFWRRALSGRPALVAVLAVVLAYNVLNSAYVGARFLNDPRMEALTWVQKHVEPGSSIESTPYTPTWNLVYTGPLDVTQAPFISGRVRLFQDLSESSYVRAGLENEPDNIDWYTEESLADRQPDFLAVDSLYTSRFQEGTRIGELYPTMGRFFATLLDEELGYRIVFDRASPETPAWAYPSEIDFLNNRLTVLEREKRE